MVPQACDDFDGTVLDPTKWYSPWLNTPGGTKFAWWIKGAVQVNNGLTIVSRQGPIGATGRNGWQSGGIGQKFSQVCGGYVWAHKGMPQKFLSNIFQLFPLNGPWPPEMDLFEDDGSRKQTSGTVHHSVDGCNVDPHHYILRKGVDTTQWGVWGAWWTPGELTLTHNGKTWWVCTRDISTAPLNFVIQSEYYGTVAPAPTSQANALDVAWVRTYAPVEGG